MIIDLPARDVGFLGLFSMWSLEYKIEGVFVGKYYQPIAHYLYSYLE